MSLQALIKKIRSAYKKAFFEAPAESAVEWNFVTSLSAGEIQGLIEACEVMRNDLEIIAVGGQHERTSVAWARAALAKADKVCEVKL